MIKKKKEEEEEEISTLLSLIEMYLDLMKIFVDCLRVLAIRASILTASTVTLGSGCDSVCVKNKGNLFSGRARESARVPLVAQCIAQACTNMALTWSRSVLTVLLLVHAWQVHVSLSLSLSLSPLSLSLSLCVSLSTYLYIYLSIFKRGGLLLS